MLVSNFLNRLTAGPVGDLSIGGNRNGTIPPAHIDAMFDRAQGALTELHRRFPLSIKTITISTMDGRFLYPLEEQYAITSALAPGGDKFILDTMSNQFLGTDILILEHVLDADRNEVGLNDRHNATSWFTVAFNVLSMDYPVANTLYFVQYRADHNILNRDVNTFATTHINIPRNLEEVFLARVAYEVFLTQTGENAAIMAQSLLSKYNALSSELEMDNSLNSSVVEDRACLFKQRGWV